MTIKQLETRLNRIRKKEKLLNFIIIARENNQVALVNKAWEKAHQLGYTETLQISEGLNFTSERNRINPNRIPNNAPIDSNTLKRKTKRKIKRMIIFD